MVLDLRFSTKEEASKFLEETKKSHGPTIAGVDEVARGPLFGAAVVGCVILPENHQIKGIKDSKKLSPKRRAQIAEEIMDVAVWGLGIAEPEEIDQVNVYQAIKRAATDAVNSCAQKLSLDFVLCDGGLDLSRTINTLTVSVIKGDNWFECISAASIIAKVYHDQQMEFYHDIYPEYGLINHMGYATKDHIAAIEKFGITPFHRKSFGHCRTARMRDE